MYLVFAALLLVLIRAFMQPSPPENSPAAILDAPGRDWPVNAFGENLGLAGVVVAFCAFCLQVILFVQNL